MQLVSLQACCVAITLAAATLCYLNTLPAGFAFDDNFAVVSARACGRVACIPFSTRSPSLAPSQIYNGDVTNDGNPLGGLFVHDFWCAAPLLPPHQAGPLLSCTLSSPAPLALLSRGQRIRSDMSHKSYRPFTVISFRLSRLVWQRLPKAWTSKVESAR